MKTMNASTARKLFARALELVMKDGEPVVIVRYRQPVAAIVPISRLTAAERAIAQHGSKVDGQNRRRSRSS